MANAAKPASPPPIPAIQSMPPQTVPIARNREEWRSALSRLHHDKGCYQATFPRIEWREVSCQPGANIPFPPRHGGTSLTVGNGADFAGRVTNPIVGVEGAYDSVVTTGESGFTAQSPTTPVEDAYTLQVNSNFANNSFCTGSCLAWQQAVFSDQTEHALFMQYWLIDWPTTCPPGWSTYITNFTSCYMDSPHFGNIPVEPVSNLQNMVLKMDASSSLDTVELYDGTIARSVSNSDNIVELSTWWRDAEFNIFGDCCSFSANFDPNSTLIAHNTVHHGSITAPTCVFEGFTAETNNLTLTGTVASTLQNSPAIIFAQSNVSGSPPGTCVAAQGIGDTHLTTLSGLYYDFQAQGDFLLLSDGPRFSVQSQQKSGAPNWPNAAVNKQVATRMGDTTVAVCVQPFQVQIDGQQASIADGQTITTPDGVNITRTGNTYTTTDQQGDSMRAVVNFQGTDWINVYVGMGRRPSATTVGLLVNPNNNVNQIATRGGSILYEPVSFTDLYHRYGDSWRLREGESVLCSGKAIKSKNPKNPFYASDLDPALYAQAWKICTDAGITILPLLDACTLDVAVIGNKAAANAFVGEPAPVAVRQAGQGRCKLPAGDPEGAGGSHTCPAGGAARR